jgi:phospholipid/cholesterol/gamma-HCH transport system substrate-binding protein/paraquat-inducible protein B
VSEEARYFRVGSFVLGGIALAVATIVVVGGGRLLRRPAIIETYFEESVQGLEVGSPVKLRGVKLGTVKAIGFVGDEYRIEKAEDPVKAGNLVLVRMEITAEGMARDERAREHGVRALIERGLRLKLTPFGITGTSFLQADLLDPVRYPPMEIFWEPEYLYVPSAPSTITEISSAAERLMTRIDRLDVERLLTNLDALLVRVNDAVGKADVEGVQRSVSAVLDDLRRTSAEVRGAVSRSGVDRTSEEARDTLRQANLTLLRLQELLEGGSDEVGATLENLRVASQNLREASETARAYPSLLLFGAPPPPVGGESR